MAKQHDTSLPITGSVVDEAHLSLGDLSEACSVHAEFIVELVREGILDPIDAQDAAWVFQGSSLKRVRTVVNLQQDLGLNLPGAALALDLMQEVDALRAELDKLAGSGYRF